MSSKMRLFVSVVAVTAFALSAQAVVMHDGVPSSEYEAVALRPEYSASGYLELKDNSLWKMGGSFDLIDTLREQDMGFWGTTAGHVAYNGGTTLYDGYRAGFGSNQLNDPGARYQIDAVIPFPTYSENDAWGSTSDLALVHFATKVEGITPATRFRGTDQLDTLLTRIGYGIPGTASTGLGTYDGIERGTENVGFRFGSPTILSDYWCTRFDGPGWPYYQHLGGNGSPADSGGGSYANLGGIDYLVGITSFGRGDGYSYGSSTYSLRVSLYNDWIDQTIANYTPEPTSLMLLLAATPLVCRRRRV